MHTLPLLAIDASTALDFATAIPLAPLASLAIIFLLLVLLPRSIRTNAGFQQLCGWISVAGIATAGVLATQIWLGFFNGAFKEQMTLEGGGGLAREWTWMTLGTWQVNVGIILDPLAITTLFMVGWVATMIQVFSIGYMKGEEHFPRYFAYHSLFVTGMLLLVISDNFLTLLVGWELMGLCSYLLIGFYTKKATANAAQLKAFMTTRLADMFMLLGIALVMGILIQTQTTGVRAGDPELTRQVLTGAAPLQYATWQDVSNTSFQFRPIQEGIATTLAADPASFPGHLKVYGLLMIAAFLVFVGTMGKSAQFPLHVWLPDAMEGPTPVSALIHAATMVAAGVYLVARTYFLFDPLSIGVSPVLLVIAVIGGFTAIWAATIGLAQYDIKRILAYSTLSQLGYMVAGLGVGAFAAGVFHLVTHAYFKALLFLGSGAVILACHHNQDIRYMGNLRKYLTWSFWAYMVGYLALIGTPGLAGAFSKDAIIAGALDRSYGEAVFGYHFVLVCLLGGAFLTPLYMTRQVALVFWGTKYRGDENPDAHHHGQDDHGHEAAHGHDQSDAHHAAHDPHALIHTDDLSHGAHGHDGHHGGEPKEQPLIIWGPLAVLALFTILIGWLYSSYGPFLTKTSVPATNKAAFGGVPSVFASAYYPRSYKAKSHDDHNGGHGDAHGAHGEETDHGPVYVPGLIKHAKAEPIEASHDAHLGIEVLVFLLAGLGVLTGWLIYGRNARVVFGKTKDEFKATPGGAWLYRVLHNKYYVDEFYAAYIITPFLVLTHLCRAFDTFVMDGIVNAFGLLGLGLTRVARWVDQRIVDGMVNAVAWFTGATSRAIRGMQSGYIQNYFMVMVISVLLWLWYAHGMQITTASNEGQVHPMQAIDQALQQGGLPPAN